jgi:hypothetical protein
MDTIQTGLRLPENQHERIRKKADRIGISMNQMILVLVDIGLNCLDKEPDEFLHSVPRNQKCTS